MPKCGDMLCGHHYSHLVQDKEGTCYCDECEHEAYKSAEAFGQSRKEQEAMEKTKAKGNADAFKDS